MCARHRVIPSPLDNSDSVHQSYTLNGIWPSHHPVPPPQDVIGGLSAIFWALTIIPLIKYVRIILLPTLDLRLQSYNNDLPGDNMPSIWYTRRCIYQ